LAEVMQQLDMVRQNELAPEIIDRRKNPAPPMPSAISIPPAPAWEDASANATAAQGAYEAARDALQTAAAAHTKLQAEALWRWKTFSPSPKRRRLESDHRLRDRHPGFEAALGAALGDDLSAAGDDASPCAGTLLPPSPNIIRCGRRPRAVGGRQSAGPLAAA